MSTPFCFQPENPNITGIGVRVSLYVSFFIAILSEAYYGVASAEPPASFSELWRVHFYTYLSIVIATLTQAAQRDLSLFHTIASAHLANLILVSGFAEMLFQVGDGLETKHWQPTSVLAHIMLHLFYLADISSFYNGRGHCILTNHSDKNVFDNVIWVLCFGLRVRGQLGIWSPLVTLCLFPILGIFTCRIYSGFIHYCMRNPTEKMIHEMIIFSVSVFLFGVHEIFSIEQSLRANPELDDSAENKWGFGQVTTVVLLPAFVDPFFDIMRAYTHSKYVFLLTLVSGNGFPSTSIRTTLSALLNPFLARFISPTHNDIPSLPPTNPTDLESANSPIGPTGPF